MNLLDTASLVVTPNGYKASKLYSIVPSDGSGDMTFARTGNTATRVNSSGLIESVNANVPRLDYKDSTCPKLLLEPQRTNLFPKGSALTSTGWISSGATLTSGQTDPNGGTTAMRIQLIAGSGKYTYYALSASNGAYTRSMYIKSSANQTIQIGEIYGGAMQSINVTTSWQRVTITRNNFISGEVGIEINNQNDNLAKDITIAFVQLEAGSYATSYIPTTTASVTRNADVCSKTSATALIGQTEGTMFFDGYYGNNADEVYLFLKKAGTAAVNDSIFLQKRSSSQIALSVYTGSTNQAFLSGGSYSLGSRIKIAAAYKSNDFVLYINGVQIGTDNSGTVPTCDSIYIGTYSEDPTNETLIANKGINTTVLWKTRLTNQELVTLTTI